MVTARPRKRAGHGRVREKKCITFRGITCTCDVFEDFDRERFPGTLLVEDLAVKGSESNARVSDGIVVATRSIGSREEIVLED